MQSQTEVMPRVKVSSGGDQLRAGGKRFVSLGFNYGCGSPSLDKALDFFYRPRNRCRARVRRHMRKAKELGANTLRVYLELFAFIRRGKGNLRVRDRALDQLDWMLAEAERQGLYLDLTGNLVWRTEQSRRWYDAMSPRERWRVQARFWRAIAGEVAGSPAVLVYELTSEPHIPNSDPGSWYGGDFGGRQFVQYLIRDLGGRDPDEVARSWIKRLSRAIRKKDDRGLIGVGLAGFTGVESPLGPANTADLLDVLITHEYPKPGAARSSINRVREFNSYGLPVIVGETALLLCPGGDYEEFLLGISSFADGYISFFDGRAPADVEIRTDYDRFYLRNLELFVGLGPRLLPDGGASGSTSEAADRPSGVETLGSGAVGLGSAARCLSPSSILSRPPE